MAKNVTLPALVGAGFAAVEEHGLAGLTMRDVARRLDVQAPAIYWHVSSRAALIDEMATQLWREILGVVLAGAGEQDVVETLAGFARELRRQVLARRDGARLLAGTRLLDDDLLRAQQEVLARDPGRARATVTAYALVYNFTVGYVIEEQARLADPESYDPHSRAARLGDADAALSELVLATGDERFEELLAFMINTVRRELLPD